MEGESLQCVKLTCVPTALVIQVHPHIHTYTHTHPDEGVWSEWRCRGVRPLRLRSLHAKQAPFTDPLPVSFLKSFTLLFCQLKGNAGNEPGDILKCGHEREDKRGKRESERWRPISHFSRRLQCDSAITQRRGLCKSEFGWREGGTQMESESERRGCIKHAGGRGCAGRHGNPAERQNGADAALTCHSITRTQPRSPVHRDTV